MMKSNKVYRITKVEKGSSLWWFKFQLMWVMLAKAKLRIDWCKRHGFKTPYKHIPS